MRVIFFFFNVFCLCFSAHALEEQTPKKSVCLNMIVKDESQVITRCLGSVKPLIDYWVIVDTGSTDNTQAIIKEFMQDIPGELIEQPWVNFEFNRNHALECAKGKGDYILIIDADETLVFDCDDYQLPPLDKDFYYILTNLSGLKYLRVQLINSKLNWKWTGVVHEVLDATQAKSRDTLNGITNIPRTDGARSKDSEKYLKDARLLEKALETDPHNTRHAFYLAQSYRDYGDQATALKCYEKRVAMGGWDQEVFWSLLQIARLQEALKLDSNTVMKGYYRAFHYRPKRAEPLLNLAKYYRLSGDYASGYLIASIGLAIPKPDDILFVESCVYDYDLLLEFSICAYWIGLYDQCQVASRQLLSNSELPTNVRTCVENNLRFATQKIEESKNTNFSAISEKIKLLMPLKVQGVFNN